MTESSSDKNSNFQNRPIGIFDSGFGGLTVMRAIRELLPQENILYFGDTARLPYGNKSAETVQRYVLENVAFLIESNVKLLVIACNTACAFAFELVQNSVSIPVVGVVESGVASATAATRGGAIGILGTRGTILSGIYQQKFKQTLPLAPLIPISCPLFVPLVEEGYIEHPLTKIAISEYLRPLKDQSVDTLLLGCTHYPLISSLIQKEVGEEVVLVDPALSCAQQIKKILEENQLCNQETGTPFYQFFVSDDPEKFRLLGNAYLNYPIEHVAAARP